MGAIVMENREMDRIKCTVAYDGMHFCGYQIQPNHRTVQQEIEKALQKLHKGELVRVQASGRTDSTVHAKGQVIHFDTPLSLEEWQWSNALNTMLPDDIVIRQVEKKQKNFMHVTVLRKKNIVIVYYYQRLRMYSVEITYINIHTRSKSTL